MKKRNIKFHLTAKKLIVILFVFIVSTASASTIHIPDDYSTIQAGIDAASYGDVVLVDVGTYVENINFNGKNITVSINYSPSLNKGKQRQAIIDGNGDGSVVTFENGENSNAVLDGFTIQNGHALINGGGIYCDGASPTLKNLTIKDNSVQYYDGGGIYCGNGSHPEINNSEITNNSAYNGGGIVCRDGSSPTLNSLEIKHNTASYNGGGLYCYNSSPQVENSIFLNNTSQTGGAISCRLSANPDLTNLTLKTNTADYGGGLSCYNSSSPSLNYVSITNNTAQARGGGIYCYDSSPVFNANNSCNLHSNLVTSQRGAGLEIFSEECTDISVIVDTFTVMSPSDRYASPLAIYTFDIDHSMEDDLINADLYVAEDGDDSNSGTSAAEPLQTIKHALDIIYSDAANINTIHVAAGTYSPSNTGEEFPLRWSNYVNLSGDEAGTTILDAEGTAGVLEFRDVDEALIQDLTLKGGSAKYGGGVYCNYASPELKHLAIVENTVLYDGAGVYCYHSQPQLTNLTISNNEGDGVYCLYESSLTILNTIVTDNTGHGVYDQIGDDTTVEYCDVWNNAANYGGCSAGTGTISADPLFIDMNAGDYHLATTSPCIDTGDPTSPQDPDGTNADMGAFYYHQYNQGIEGTVVLNGGSANVTDVIISTGSGATHPSDTGDYYLSLPVGTYEVTASLTDYADSTISGVVVEENQNTLDVDFTLQPLPAPVADFTADQNSGCGSLQVQFTDQSLYNPNSWSWNFGDGDSSSFQNPVHTYTEWGVYTVSLTVSNDYGSDTITKTDYITVNGRPVAEAGPDQTVLDNETVYLDGSGSYDPEGEDLNYHWNAPTGIELSDSTIVDPSFVAPDIDDSTDYNIILTVDDGDCYSEPDAVCITVTNNPAAVDETSPQEFVLEASFPNPVRTKATINYALPRAGEVAIELYDTKGRKLKQIIKGRVEAGDHSDKINVANLPNGIYFYRVKVDGKTQAVQKLVKLD